MSELQQYVKKIKRYMKDNPNISEEKLIRYVYLDLGQRFSFDLKFAFGNTKTRTKLYRKSANLENLDKAITIGEGNCRAIANVLKYVLRSVGVDVTTEIVDIPYIKCPHVYNVIKQKDGKIYSVDLQEDLERIQSHSFTKKYGLSIEDSKKYILKRLDIEKMDRELGYINDENYYADDYLYMLKADLDGFCDFNEKIQFLLDNIDICENKEINYAERKWHHQDILRKVLSKQEINKIHMLDCYVEQEGNRTYLNYIAVDNKGKSDIYVYDIQYNGYKKTSLEELANDVKSGLVVLQKVHGLNKLLYEEEK